jgi:hypothetical protein
MDHLEDPGIEEGNLKMDLQEVEWGGMDWIIRLTTGTGGRLL